MSNEFKLVPVEPTPEMLRAGLASNGIVPVYTAMLAAAPQPPALGGEPEATAWIITDEDGTIDATVRWDVAKHSLGEATPMISKAVHRAHLAPLQAEIERLKSEAEENHKEREVICANYDQLKAQGDELEKAFRKLRDVAHGCEQIASSYSPCIDSVEEHGGDDHEDPSCAIHHRLYYAMFDADAALSKPAGSEQV